MLKITDATPITESVTIAGILMLVEQDYIHNERRSFKSAFKLNRDHLLSCFEGTFVAEHLTVTHLNAYITIRRKEGAQNGTINRELSTLHRGFTLGLKSELLHRSPPFTKLAENNTREGFVEIDEYEKVKAYLEPRYRRPYIFGFYNGWRRGEIISLKKEFVDVQRGVIRLSKKLSKNGKGRVVVLTGECLTAVREACAESQSDYVFQGPNGHAHISGSQFYLKTKEAFAAAGIKGRMIHDLRRSAYRNLLRAGNHDKIAREFTGHKTRDIAERYDIVNEDDIFIAAQKAQRYVETQRSENGVKFFTPTTQKVDSGTTLNDRQGLGFSTVSGGLKLLKSLVTKLLKGKRP